MYIYIVIRKLWKAEKSYIIFMTILDSGAAFKTFHPMGMLLHIWSIISFWNCLVGCPIYPFFTSGQLSELIQAVIFKGVNSSDGSCTNLVSAKEPFVSHHLQVTFFEVVTSGRAKNWSTSSLLLKVSPPHKPQAINQQDSTRHSARLYYICHNNEVKGAGPVDSLLVWWLQRVSSSSLVDFVTCLCHCKHNPRMKQVMCWVTKKTTEETIPKLLFIIANQGIS